MFKDIEAVIFDLDGTLIDSMWVWEKIDEEYLDRFNKEKPDDLSVMIEGRSFRETAELFKSKFQLPRSIEEIEEDWNNMAWDKYKSEVTLKKGAMKLLQTLKEKKIKMGIATSNSRKLVELVTKANGISDFFDYVCTATEVQRGKPEPDIYLRVAKGLNKDPKKCLVFEDVINGIIAGKRANMKVCAVYDEATKDSTNQKIEVADYYVENFTDIVWE